MFIVRILGISKLFFHCLKEKALSVWSSIAGKKSKENVLINWFSIYFKNEKLAVKQDVNGIKKTAADSINSLCFL